jgi:uncharacterized protein YjbI with pentapeptide repeats
MSKTSTDTSPTNNAPNIGDAWGDDFSEERQRELDAILAAWDAETDHGDRKIPFHRKGLPAGSDERKRLELSGADVFYLAARALVGKTVTRHCTINNLDDARFALRDPIQMRPPDLSALNLASAYVVGKQLKGAILSAAHLESTAFGPADLQEAWLYEAHLEDANLAGAQLQHADLERATSQRADLRAELEGANLCRANLEGAELSGARLKGALLYQADLRGADLRETQLQGADLRFSRLDREANLTDAHLAGVSLDQIVLDNTNLTALSWEDVAPLGDDKRAKGMIDDDYRPGVTDHKKRIDHYESAVRANRLLATELRRQGLAEDADIVAYRAALMQRGLRFRRRQFGRWLVSWGLAALSGYGYRLWRIFFAYGLVLAVFAFIFWALGVHSFAEASAEPPPSSLSSASSSRASSSP